AGRAARQLLRDRRARERDVGRSEELLDGGEIELAVAWHDAEHVPGDLLADLHHEKDAFRRLRGSVSAEGADDVGAALRRMVEEAVARAVPIEELEELDVLIH